MLSKSFLETTRDGELIKQSGPRASCRPRVLRTTVRNSGVRISRQQWTTVGPHCSSKEYGTQHFQDFLLMPGSLTGQASRSSSHRLSSALREMAKEALEDLKAATSEVPSLREALTSFEQESSTCLGVDRKMGILKTMDQTCRARLADAAPATVAAATRAKGFLEECRARLAVAAPATRAAATRAKERIEEDRHWAAQIAASFAPALGHLQASGSGIMLQAVPAVPPPDARLCAGQRRQQPMQMQQDDEDEEFAALIFPGFKADSFIWRVTQLQMAEFVFSMFLGHSKANPLPCVLYRLGASWGPSIARGELWRLFTPVMLHASLTHLMFNVFFQLRIGFGMERQFGTNKMTLTYIVCGLFGNLLSVVMDPTKLAVGASTAGFGLIGVWIAEIVLSWNSLGAARERTLLWIGFMLISVTTMSSMTPNTDLYGHLGGAVGGFLTAIMVSDMPEAHRPAWYPAARTAASLLFVLFLTGGLGKVLLLNPRDPIPDCALSMNPFESLRSLLPGGSSDVDVAVASIVPMLSGQ